MKSSFFQERHKTILETAMRFIALALLVILISELRKGPGEILRPTLHTSVENSETATCTTDSFPFGIKRPSSMTFYYMEGDEMVEDYTVRFLYDGRGRLAAGNYERGVNAGRISYLYSDGKLFRREDSLIYSTEKSRFVYGSDGRIIRYIEKFDTKKQLAQGTVTEYSYDSQGALQYAVRRTVMNAEDEDSVRPLLIVFQYGDETDHPYERREGNKNISDIFYRPGGGSCTGADLEAL